MCKAALPTIIIAGYIRSLQIGRFKTFAVNIFAVAVPRPYSLLAIIVRVAQTQMHGILGLKILQVIFSRIEINLRNAQNFSTAKKKQGTQPQCIHARHLSKSMILKCYAGLFID